jgi:uncharacterized protein (TIGR04255 family)
MGKESVFPVYNEPPVVETVFSVQFEGLPAQSVRLSQYWPNVRDRYPKIGVAPPLPTVFEPTFLTPNFQPLTISFEQDNRVVLDGDDYLLQFQSNRFLLNWRRSSGSSQYPGFVANFPRFKAELNEFQSFVHGDGIGEIQSFNQLELTYVNIFDVPNDSGAADFGGIFRDHCRNYSGDRYLPAPEIMNWNSSYKMEENNARLHVSSNAFFSGVESGSKLQIRVELTARGKPAEPSVVAFDSWFENAHSYVVKGFADVIDNNFQVQKLGRTT